MELGVVALSLAVTLLGLLAGYTRHHEAGPLVVATAGSALVVAALAPALAGGGAPAPGPAAAGVVALAAAAIWNLRAGTGRPLPR